MADYSISTQITLDDSKFSSGVKNAQKSTKKLSSAIGNITKGFGKGGLAGSITSAGLALGGIGLAINTAIKAFQKISKTISECTDAYKNQLVVERALDTAISNSPFISGSASKSLKEFASEMQRVSNLGDEEVIPMMTQLVATGRSEAEVMQIIKTASDMASSGAMSFDAAVTQLNATLNGNIGRLGQQNAELKGLTEEELKSGKAVEILAEKYKGLSQATIDTSKQLKNIKDDFKEALGQFTLPTSDMWNKFWTGFYSKGIEIINMFNDALDKSFIGKGIASSLETELRKLTDSRERRLYAEDEIHLISDDQLKALKNYLESLKNLTKEQEVLLKVARDETESRIYLEQLYKEMDAEEAERQKLIQEQKDAEDEIVKLKEEYLKKVAEQEAKWKNIETVTGEVVGNEEKIKFYQDSLVDLMTQANGQITTNNQLYKDQLAIIQKLQEGLEPEEKKTSDVWVENLRKQAIERLEAEKDAYDQSVDLEKTTALERYLIRKEYNEKIIALQKEQLMAEREKALKSVEGTANEYEEKARIIEYYNNEIEKLGKGMSVKMEVQGKNAGKAFAKGFSVVVNGIKTVMSKVMQTIKSIKGFTGIFKNIFEFNPDEALDNLLVFEDKILTFFVETLPKLPQFFKSVFQSISVLLQNILNSGGFKFIGDIIGNILESIVSNLPAIINGITDIVLQIVDRLEPIFDKTIPVLFDVIISTTEKLMKKLPQIIKIIVKVLSTVIQAIVKSLPAILKAIIPNLLKAVLELIKSLLKEIPKIIVVLINALPDIISAVIKGLVEFLSNLSGKDIAMFVKGFIQAVAQIAMALIQNITKIVAELIPLVVQIIVELIKSIPDILKGLVEGAWEGLKWAGEKIWEGIKGIGEGIKGIGKKIAKGFKKLFGFANGTNDAPRGLALVGEAGPELVRFRGGEQVINNKNTQKLLSDSGKGGSIFNVTFNNTQDTTAFAMLNQLKQYQRNLAFSGIL